jgi:hypothetical protein
MKRALWMLLALAGFGVGFFVARQDGSEDGQKVVHAAPARVPTAPPPAPAPPPPEPKPKPRPVFTSATLPKQIRTQLRNKGLWHGGCPVALSDLRLLTVSYRGFDGRLHTGALVVNAGAAKPLRHVFRRLYRMRFPIRHVGFSGFDPTASFECRQSVPSPCTGGLKSGHWSMHAYGLAVDLNPTENPYVGCGQSRDPSTKPYRDRTRHKRGMVDDRVVAAFASVGWGWGGSWAGSTKDYMHFSSTGH